MLRKLQCWSCGHTWSEHDPELFGIECPECHSKDVEFAQVQGSLVGTQND
jgi:Zn finger protein HypA/HybF involved in hydrogenase expression